MIGDAMTQGPSARALPRRDLGRLAAAALLTTVLIAAIVGPLILPPEGVRQDLLIRNQPPFLFGGTLSHLLGTDPLGRDMLARLLSATSTSILISLSVLILAFTFGSSLGLMSGVSGGTFDDVLMRVVDIAIAFPSLLVAVAFLFVFGASPVGVVVVLAATRWPVFARVARGETIRLRESEFMEAYTVLGYGRLRKVREGLVPNVAPIMTTLAAVTFGQIILAEAALSFLGLGVQKPSDSWGLMISEGRGYTTTAWWVVVIPGLAIVATVIASSSLAEWLATLVDPLRRSGDRGHWR